MKLTLQRGTLVFCLQFVASSALFAQDQAPPTPAPESSTQAPAPPAPPPAREVPSKVNTGGGFSIEPFYWVTSAHPRVVPGQTSLTTDTGPFDYPGTARQTKGGTVSIPMAGTSVLRFTYFQTQKDGFTSAPRDLAFVGNTVTSGDPLATRYKIADWKVSFDYLTYFFKRGGNEFRIKTLWEFQYVNMTSDFTDFAPQSDGSFLPTPFTFSNSAILPTIGLGLENTIGRHFRWELKGSGFGLPHRSVIGDTEADIAFRVSHVELILGAKDFYFKSSPKKDLYDRANLFGPYAGLRFYWKKQ